MRYIQSIIVTATSQSQVESARDGARELLFHLEAIAVIVMLWISFQWYSQGNSRLNQSKRIGDRGVLAQLRDLSALLALIVALMHAAVPTLDEVERVLRPFCGTLDGFCCVERWAAHIHMGCSRSLASIQRALATRP